MKKLFLSLFLILSVGVIKAQDEYSVQILPANLTSNTPLLDADNKVTTTNVLQFYLHEGNNFQSKNVNAIQIYFFLPNGLDATATYYDEDEEDDVTTSLVTGDKRSFNATSSGSRNWGLLKCSDDQQTIPGYTKYLITAYCTGATKILRDETYADANGNGSICKVSVGTSGISDGIYPVYVEDVILAESATLGHEIAERTTSFVKVGNPKDQTVILNGDIASFVNEALATETGISTLDLTNVTASNGTFTYVDGRAVKAPKAEVKGKVAYKRAVSGLASLCLPFAADVKAYTYTSMSGDIAIFDEVSTLEAGTAAIVDANIDITVENATIGGVEAQEITSGYYLKGGQLCKVNGTAKIAPLRGCWDIAAGVKGFKFGDADAIMSIDANANEDIYNLNGMKLDKAQRGVNIIGGKKVMK